MNGFKLAGEIIGALALLEGIFIFISFKRERILKLKFLSDGLWFFNYLLLGAYTGALLNLIAMGRESIFYLRDRRRFASHIFWLPFFMALTLLSPLSEYLSAGSLAPVTVLPAVGSMLSVVGLYQRNTNHIRCFALVSALLWLCYAFSVGNITATVSNAIAGLSALIGLLRYVGEKKKSKEK